MPTGYLLVDANVLIDYLATDPTVLTLAARGLGRVHVLSTVLDEVDGLDEAQCARLGIEVVEPELSQVVAASVKRGSLSAEDHLCLIVARARGWTCVTNDGALRRACSAQGVPILWGLQVMSELVAAGELEADEAIAVARVIHENNPLHIPEALVERFAVGVRKIVQPRGRQR